jgi:transposase
MSLPKWTDERTAQLTDFVGSESPVSQETVAAAAVELETTARSVASKLRKMDFDVQSATEKASVKAYSEDQEAALRALVTENSGEFTYADIANQFDEGQFSAKSVQGKILSMELTAHVKPTPKVETVRTYSESEEAVFVAMARGGASIEDIAAKLGKSVASARGKALSLLRTSEIEAIPHQANKAAPKVDALEALGDVSGKTVEEIAEALEKTVRGVKTMLTKRGIKVANYDGAARKEKASA